jgi:hypothetical protein
MQNDLKHHQLAFLLSLGALPIACTTSDDDSTTNDTAATMTGTATNTTMSTGTEDTGTATNQTTDNSTSGVTTDVSTSDTGYADSTTGNIDIPPVCQMYGDHLAKCGIRYADSAPMYCAYALMYDEAYGEACVMADSDYYACLAMADCAELMDKMATPCEPELNAYLDACGGGTSTGGTGTGGSTSTTM